MIIPGAVSVGTGSEEVVVHSSQQGQQWQWSYWDVWSGVRKKESRERSIGQSVLMVGVQEQCYWDIS